MEKKSFFSFPFRKVDTKEFELPDTLFVRDIDNKVFEGIILQCLSQIEGISLIHGTFLEHVLGHDRVQGIHTEQDPQNHSVTVRIEVNISYGIPIPAKADEIQTRVAEEITALTGLHVAAVHVIFKALTPQQQPPSDAADA